MSSAFRFAVVLLASFFPSGSLWAADQKDAEAAQANAATAKEWAKGALKDAGDFKSSTYDFYAYTNARYAALEENMPEEDRMKVELDIGLAAGYLQSADAYYDDANTDYELGTQAYSQGNVAFMMADWDAAVNYYNAATAYFNHSYDNSEQSYEWSDLAYRCLADANFIMNKYGPG